MYSVYIISNYRGFGLLELHYMHGDLVVDCIVVPSYSREMYPSVANVMLLHVRYVSLFMGIEGPLGMEFILMVIGPFAYCLG